MSTLHLILKKEWYTLIDSGEKKEEYRDLKPYWIKRLVDIKMPEEQKGENKIIPADIVFDILLCHDWEKVLKSYYSKIREFDSVIFKNGYSSTAPTMGFKIDTIVIDKGLKHLGAQPGKKYFVIKLGERIL